MGWGRDFPEDKSAKCLIGVSTGAFEARADTWGEAGQRQKEKDSGTMAGCGSRGGEN